jgi:hypothetical protein
MPAVFALWYVGGITRTIWWLGGLVVLMLALPAAEATAQDRTAAASGAPEHRLSLEGAAGLQVYYRGSMQSIAFGFAPTRSLTLLVSAERSYVRDTIEQYEDGYAFERGGTERFVSVEVRYAFLLSRRVSPYVLGGGGGGISRPNVNEFFPDRNDREIQVFYYGAGVRIPIRPWLDVFGDGRFVMALEARSDYFGVRYPIRAGVAWRF